MRCSQCGEQNDPGLRYCVACGTALGTDGQRPVPEPEKAPLPQVSIDSIQAGTVLKGTYEIVRVLGEGGAGAVYEGRHVQLGHQIAVKVLFAELARIAQIRERFLSEGRIQANFRHANLVGVSDIIEETGLVAIVMEYVEGETLHHFIQRQTRPAEMRKCVDIMLRLLAGLAVVHEQGIVHRDIKPGNVLLGRSDDGVIPKLCDFGIAKVDSAKRGLTVSGTQMGTLHYMAPEQFQDAGSVDARADIYSLGVTFFEMLTGRLPFDSDNEYALMRAHLDVKPPSPRGYRPELHEALERIVLRTLEKRPADRYQSTEDFAEALLSIPQFGKLQNYRSMPVVTDVDPVDLPMQVGVGHGTRHKMRKSLQNHTGRRTSERSMPAPEDVLTRRLSKQPEKTSGGGGISAFAVFLWVFALGLGGVIAWWFTAGPGAGVTEPDAGPPDVVVEEVGPDVEQDAGVVPTDDVEPEEVEEEQAAVEMETCRSLIEAVMPLVRSPLTEPEETLGERLAVEAEGCENLFGDTQTDREIDRAVNRVRRDLLVVARHVWRTLQAEEEDAACIHALQGDRAYRRAMSNTAQALGDPSLPQIETRPIREIRDLLRDGQGAYYGRYSNCLR